MRYLDPNPVRGFFGLLGFICIAAGAGFLWGFGGWLLAIGACITIDVTIDAVLERLTNTKIGADPALSARMRR